MIVQVQRGGRVENGELVRDSGGNMDAGSNSEHVVCGLSDNENFAPEVRA